MRDFQANTLNGGLDTDSDKRLVAGNKMTYANNAELMPFEAGKLASAEPIKSTSLSYTVPSFETQYQYNRCIFFGTGLYRFVIGTSNVAFTQPNNTWADFVTNFTNAFNAVSTDTLTITIDTAAVGEPFIFSVQDSLANPISYNVTFYFNGEQQPCPTVQDAIEGGDLLPIASCNIQNIQLVFSVNATTGTYKDCQEIGIAKEENGVSAYTTIVRTNKFGWDRNAVFDIRIENQANEYYGFYWTDFDKKPKVLYVDKNYTTNCALKWTVADFTTEVGLYTLNAIDEQTNLQIVNNLVRVQYSDQLQGGGNLLSGGYRYAIRCGINGTGNVTEWCYLSNLIPVFKTSINSPSAWSKIQGDKSGETTGKVNILQVDGAKSDVFNFVELAAVYYAGGATTAYVVKRQNITTDSFTISHTGFEDTTSLDVAELPPVDELILRAESLEIKKNRLNLVNDDIAITDGEFAELSLATNDTNLSFGIVAEEIDSVGKLGSITGTDVYALKTANQNINGSTPSPTIADIIFENEVVDNYGQFASNTFTCIAPYTSITFSSVITSKTTTPSLTYYIRLIKNGTPIYTADIQTLTSTDYFTYDLGQIFSGSTQMQIPCVAGDTFKLDVSVVGFAGITQVTIKSGSYVSFTNGTSPSPYEDTTVGEYQLPENVANKMGYMKNDSYRWYARYHLANGYITEPYFICEREITGVQNFTNNNPANHKAIIYKGVLGNIPAATLRSMGVRGISIWRAVCNPTILGTGVLLQADRIITDNYGSGYYAGIPTANNAYAAAVPNSDARRKYGLFISSDTRISQPQFNQGDTLIDFGEPAVLNNAIANSIIIKDLNNLDVTCNGSYAEYLGTPISSVTPTDVDIVDTQYLQFNSAGTPMGSSQYIPSTIFGTYNGGGSATEAIAVALDTYVNNNSLGEDNGVHLCQYKRALTEQYNEKSLYVTPTGTFIEINDDSPDVINGVSVYGGDTYVQKCIVKLMYGSANRVNPNINQYSFITYYAANRVNAQLFYTDKTQDSDSWNLWAWNGISQYLFPTAVNNGNPQEQFNYDKGYIAPNIINQANPYDSTLQRNSHFGSRIWYSEQKPTGSVYDFFRKIKPLNFKDLDAKNGDICAFFDVNDVMVAVQPNCVSVLPYQSDVAVSGTGGAEVYIGQGSVYAQRERVVSGYGTNIKTAVARGLNSNGNYILYWYSNLFKKMMRYGSDGVKCISDQNNMRSWFLNNTEYIKDNFDIIMGYDSNRDCLVITSRAFTYDATEWDVGTTYNVGDTVYYSAPDKCNTFELIPNVYISSTSSNLGNNPYDSTTNWTFTQALDNRWTLIYNERINAFTTFSMGGGRILPARYFGFMGRILAPSPRAIDPQYGDVYELFGGNTYLLFFDPTDQVYYGTFSVEVTTNKKGLAPKRMIATSLAVGTNHNTSNNPELRVYNDSQESFVLPSEFELRMGNLVASIRNDDSDQPLIGEWFSYRITGNAYMRLLGFVNTFYDKFRTPFK